MDPAALAGGIGALNVAFTRQAAYAMHLSDRNKDRKEAPRRRVVIAAPTYRRPTAPRKRRSQVDRSQS
jgi:hypothetical protein